MIPFPNEEDRVVPVVRRRPVEAVDQEIAAQIKALTIEETEYKRSGDVDREREVRDELRRLRGELRQDAAPPQRRAQKR